MWEKAKHRKGDPRKHSLRDALSKLKNVVRDSLVVDSQTVTTNLNADVREFKVALQAGDLARAAELYKGHFLLGVEEKLAETTFFMDSELRDWVSETRYKLALQAYQAKVSLAKQEIDLGHTGIGIKLIKQAWVIYKEIGLEVTELNHLYRIVIKNQTLTKEMVREIRKEFSKYSENIELEETNANQPNEQNKEDTTNRLDNKQGILVLPRHTYNFVGRQAEIANINNKLSFAQLLTIFGPPGVGKTEIALKVVQEQKDKGSFGSNIYFIMLTELQTNTQILSQIAVNMGLGLQASSDLFGRIVNYLRPIPALLVLDNFEHLLKNDFPEAITLINDLRRNCPNLRLIITSRQILNVSDEVIVDVKGLSFPQKGMGKGLLNNLEDLNKQFPAIDLFVRRAKEIDNHFSLSKSNIKYAVEICQLVEGLPLGIKLVASKVKFQSLDEVVVRIRNSLDLLDDADKQGVRAVINTSWKLLSKEEQISYKKLSIFEGSFSGEAAKVVAGATQKFLLKLASMSLINRDKETRRYRFHQLLYQYAREKLDNDSKELKKTRAKHGSYFSNLLSTFIDDLTATLQVIENDEENFLTFLRWSTNDKKVEELTKLAKPLMYYFYARARFREGEEVFEQVINALPKNSSQHHDILGFFLICRAWLVLWLGEYSKSQKYAELGLKLVQSTDLDNAIVLGLITLGHKHFRSGEQALSQKLMYKGLTVARESNRVELIVKALYSVGYTETVFGNWELAKDHLSEAWHICKNSNLGDHYELSNMLTCYGYLCLCTQEYTKGLQLLNDSLAMAQRIKYPAQIPLINCFYSRNFLCSW